MSRPVMATPSGWRVCVTRIELPCRGDVVGVEFVHLGRPVRASVDEHDPTAALPLGWGRLVSTRADVHRFGRAAPRRRRAALAPIGAPHDDRPLNARAAAGVDGAGWGSGGAILADGRYGWIGGTATSARVAPSTGTVRTLLTQFQFKEPTTSQFLGKFWHYAFASPPR
jgi:hypothetical protein